MKKNDNKYKNKFLVSTIKSIIPNNNIEKTLYLNIIINDSIMVKTKNFDLKRTMVDINQIYDLGDIYKIDNIKFQILEKNGVFSNALFKGEFLTQNNPTLDEHSGSYICFLSNANLENAAVVYFNYEIGSDSIDLFENNLKLAQIDGHRDKSAIGNLKELAAGANAENFARFVKNMDYMKTLEDISYDIGHWRQPWKTFGFLVILSLCIIYTRLFFIFCPIMLLYFHVCHRSQMLSFSHKGGKHDSLENMTIITSMITTTNKVVDWYENVIDALQYSDKSLIEEIWVNLIKLFIWNIVIVLLGLFRPQLFIIISLWSFFLWRYPTFQAFAKFLYNFIYIKFLVNLLHTETGTKITNTFYRVLYSCVPFSVIIHKVIKIQGDSKLIRSSSKKTLLETFNEISPSSTNISIDLSSGDMGQGEVFRYEIYENERWWMLVGWAKNLIMNERPLWSDIAGKTYKDKNSVFLPNNEQYQWISEWQVIATDNTDQNGWEYASDFNSLFGPQHSGKYVRRRKWVRQAKKIK
jgi:hypothetical protein